MPARLVLTLGPTHFVSSIHPLLQVHNTTLLTPNVCHGVMISADVFLTHRACVAGASVRLASAPCAVFDLILPLQRLSPTNVPDPKLISTRVFPALAVFPIVMVGDYDASKPLDESVQLREVTYVATSVEHIYSGQYDDEVTLDPSNLAVGVLAEPVNFTGFVPATLNDDPDNPQPFQDVTVVGYGQDMNPVGLNLTEWPGPALEATMSAADRETCGALSSFLFGVPIYVDVALLCGLAVEPDEATPCQGTK
jgi:hypothetical protein